MQWHHVANNWPAFFGAILDRWPGADEGRWAFQTLFEY